MKITSLTKTLLTLSCTTFIQVSARAADAAWNISTLEHGVGSAVGKNAWWGPLKVKEEGGSLVMESSGTGVGDCTQRAIPIPTGFDWLVVNISEMSRPLKGYINMGLRLWSKEEHAGFVMAGNVPDTLYFTLKLPGGFAASEATLRLDSSMTRAVFSDFGLYRDPVPRFELVMPTISDAKVPASSEFAVEVHLDSPAKSVFVSFFQGRDTSPVRLASGEIDIELAATDSAKKVWRGTFSLGEATWKSQGKGPVEYLGAGGFLLKAKIVGNAKISEIWTANSRGIDFTK
ncbi:hypothetical protein BH09VER1_BH09VER1_47890 [soil metagenome]